MATYTSQRRRKRVDPDTGATLGAQDDRRAQALTRMVTANKVARAVSSSAGAAPGKPGLSQMPASRPGGTGSVNASRVSPDIISTSRSARVKDPEAESRRQYRKETYGIEDLRTAAAEQIERAKKDPKAFGGKRTVTDARLASADKPSIRGPKLPIEGRRPAQFGALAVTSGLKRRRGKRTYSRSTGGSD